MSRDKILAAIRKNKPTEVPMPPEVNYGISYENPLQQFKTSLSTAGGECHELSSEQEIQENLAELFPDCKQIYSQVKDIETFQSEKPHDYQCLDLAIFRGQLAVAENGAIFVDFSSEEQRSQAFLAQSLCLIIKKEDILANMHLAYGELKDMPDYGVFISGPSKTADIEQCLVIGAHGACALKVIII
jgi:L-lactate dehydrogenase complex protein LldG